MLDFKISLYLKFIFIISLLTTISAYYIEYILGHQPCSLCIIERIPYILSLFILLINYKFKKIEKYFVILLICVFVFSLIVSIYHFGIEQEFFEESLICNVKDGANILSKEQLLVELQKKVVSCKDVTFRIFGLSLTTINIFISLFLVVLLIKIFTSYEKKK
jgi:disulfide bond formation protein DsbB